MSDIYEQKLQELDNYIDELNIIPRVYKNYKEKVSDFIDYLYSCIKIRDKNITILKEKNERLNNIINELEKDMNNYYEEYKDVDDIVISENARVIKIYLDKLKELKGGNNG